MHKYFLKIPGWVRWIYSGYTWKVPVSEKVIFLTFDDGPHPAITPWVLSVLETYGARATFFCIGKNVAAYPDVYRQIQVAGHSVGNHTQSHVNGWKTGVNQYLNDVAKAADFIDTDLFRPPYGRIKRTQARGLATAMRKQTVKVIMWDVLSADFDQDISPEACAQIVVKHAEPGSVVVFHDSEKAEKNLRYALPKVMQKLSEKGYEFRALGD